MRLIGIASLIRRIKERNALLQEISDGHRGQKGARLKSDSVPSAWVQLLRYQRMEVNLPPLLRLPRAWSCHTQRARSRLLWIERLAWNGSWPGHDQVVWRPCNPRSFTRLS